MLNTSMRVDHNIRPILYFVSLFFFSTACFADNFAYNNFTDNIVTRDDSSSNTNSSIQNLIAKGLYDQAADTATRNTQHYLHELITKSREKSLADNPVWQVLLHYKSSTFSDATSQVDGGDYFVSMKGKTSPQKELEAILASFFSNKPMLTLEMTPQCRFPARYFWLKQQLSFDSSRLQEQECKKFQLFKKVLKADAISIIFPSAHPNSPSSMFGHTLARFDQKKQTSQNRMLAYSANYAAVDNSENQFAYAFRGLTGGFIGKFSMVPYYIKLREYNQMENRDLWEYQLKLTEDQVNFIVMHAFELEITHFDYYFFTENCSYHLLSLIETALPDLKLTDNFSGWVIPVDTIKLLENNNLISKARYYPSNSTIIKHKRSQLTNDENKLAMLILDQGTDSVLTKIKTLSEDRQAAILDLAHDYRRYNKIIDTGILEAKITEEDRKLLLARSKIKIKTNEPTLDRPKTRPDKGHETGKLSIGSGRFNDENYTTVQARAAYHGLLDDADGFSPHSQIEFFNINGRYYHDQQDFKLEKFTVIDIISLEPRDDFFRSISWRINTGWKSLPLSGTKNKTVFTVNGGGGLTYQLSQDKNTFAFGFIEAEINHSRIYDSNIQASMGISAGLLTNITGNWKGIVKMKYLSSLNNRDSGTNAVSNEGGEIALQQSVLLNKNLSLNLDLSRENVFGEYYSVLEGRVQFYF